VVRVRHIFCLEDVYLMALMFFLSGAVHLAEPSRGKGSGKFLADSGPAGWVCRLALLWPWWYQLRCILPTE